ncbi:hypothetical protein HOG21_02080 [bacterium]|jgi:hypothetical protein|nr:hypothetical protein [bacterium]
MKNLLKILLITSLLFSPLTHANEKNNTKIDALEQQLTQISKKILKNNSKQEKYKEEVKLNFSNLKKEIKNSDSKTIQNDKILKELKSQVVNLYSKTQDNIDLTDSYKKSLKENLKRNISTKISDNIVKENIKTN